MLYLHKILPLFLSPIVIAIIIVVYGTLVRSRVISLIGIVLLYAFSTSVIADRMFRHIENYEIRQNPILLPKADAIVVLSGMLHSVPSYQGTTTEWADPDRFFGGVELYKANRAGRLIFTGGLLPWSVDTTPEGAILKKYAVSMGVSETDIAVTGNAQNTEQEASAVKMLLSQSKPSIILVTSAFHMARAKYQFEKKGFSVYSYPVDFKVILDRMTPMDLMPTADALRKSDMAIREWLGMMYYKIRP